MKLGLKGADVEFKQALEIFRTEAGLDVPVRVSPKLAGGLVVITSQGEELPVGAWIQLYQDLNDGVCFVREYGLRVTEKEAVPPDAVTVAEFWKQTPAPKDEPKKK